MFKSVLIAIAAAGLAACTGAPTPAADFPETGFRFEDGYDERYLFWPGDKIDVSVLTAPELSRTVTVAPDGRVRMPLIGPVTAAGRTADELRIGLMKAYASELNQPDIDIIPTEFASQRIFVGGEVNNEAMYDLPGQIGPLQAIVMAGGFTDGAKRGQVILMRRLPGGEVRTDVVDVRAGLSREMLADWGSLQRFDVVYVPSTWISKQNLANRQWIRDALPVEFSLFYDISPGRN